MEDTVTHSISIALYRYLCQHIVGSEDHVKQIRLMNSVRDTLSSKEESVIITSGSYGEGLDMRGSDFDIMMVSSILEVYEDLKLQFNPTKTYFSMETDDVKPGYAKLKLDYSRYQYILKQCEEQNDTVTPNISIALYRYLCQHIVGSEDHVKQIRKMNAVRDNVPSIKEGTIITSGSFGEGLDMRGSDFDIMMVLRHLEVYEDVKLQFNQNITYFSIEKDDVKPGYVQLRLDYSQFPRKLFKWCEEQNGKLNLSSTLYKQWFIQNSYGIAQQLLGDTESARQAFLQSITLFPDEFYNSAVKRLLLIG
ncbi:unnamed protein product [Mytilus edulis]|uniref:Uncharacterized protein n=1 Tax=Mytilus edulis TaxID=6550 RepID=A0A8S3QRZ8_MYTED|nr:unnamed protein product [Mytilus edulis]